MEVERASENRDRKDSVERTEKPGCEAAQGLSPSGVHGLSAVHTWSSWAQPAPRSAWKGTSSCFADVCFSYQGECQSPLTKVLQVTLPAMFVNWAQVVFHLETICPVS